MSRSLRERTRAVVAPSSRPNSRSTVPDFARLLSLQGVDTRHPRRVSYLAASRNACPPGGVGGWHADREAGAGGGCPLSGSPYSDSTPKVARGTLPMNAVLYTQPLDRHGYAR